MEKFQALISTMVKPIIQSTSVVYEWWNMRKEKLSILFPNGTVGERHRDVFPEAIVIIPVTKSGTVIMNVEYRFGSDKFMLEFPGGGVVKGETPEQSAARELQEETGYQPGTLVLVHSFYRNSGNTNELVHVVLATELNFIGTNRDTEEFIENSEFTLDEIREAIYPNQDPIFDGVTIVGYYIAEKYLNNN